MRLRVVFNRQSATPIRPRVTSRGQLYYLGTLPTSQHRFVAFQVLGVQGVNWLMVSFPKQRSIEEIKHLLIATYNQYHSGFLQKFEPESEIRIHTLDESHVPCKTVGEYGAGMYFQYTGKEITVTYKYTTVADGEVLPIRNIPFAQRREMQGIPLPREFGDNFLVQSNGFSTWALLSGDCTLTRQQVSKVLRERPQTLQAILLEGAVIDIPGVYPLERKRLADYDAQDAKYYFTQDYIIYIPEMFVETLTLVQLLRRVNTDVLSHVLRAFQRREFNDRVAKDITMVRSARGDVRLCEPSSGIPFKSASAAYQHLKKIGLLQ
jgi:hypothetical protein